MNSSNFITKDDKKNVLCKTNTCERVQKLVYLSSGYSLLKINEDEHNNPDHL
jgi:hypothetical protein